jgi:hypothetical protein
MRLVFAFVFMALLLGCSKPDKAFYSVTHSKDPSGLSLDPGYNKYVKRAFLKDEEIETGIITLQDGEIIKYWFQSHHLRNDSGLTLFRLSDGQDKIMHGWFCCEVQLPEEGFRNRQTFLDYVAKYDGIEP